MAIDAKVPPFQNRLASGGFWGRLVMTSIERNKTSGRSGPSVIEVDLKNAYDASEYADLENYMSKLPGVQGVHLDRTRGVAHLTYDSSVTTAEAIPE